MFDRRRLDTRRLGWSSLNREVSLLGVFRNRLHPHRRHELAGRAGCTDRARRWLRLQDARIRLLYERLAAHPQ